MSCGPPNGFILAHNIETENITSSTLPCCFHQSMRQKKRQKCIWWFQDGRILLLFFVLKGDLQYNNMVKKPASYLCSSHTLQHNNRQVICLYCIIQMLQPHWEMRCCILSDTLSAKHKTIGDITAATSSKDGGMRKTPGSDGYLTALTHFTCDSSTNTLIQVLEL